MRIYNTLLKVAIVLMLSAETAVFAQHTVDTVPYCCDFENFVEQGFWRPANSTTNKWCIGNANNNGGSYCLYISNDNGINNSYTTSSTSYNYETRQLYVPAGIYEISYDWQCYGESSYDYIRVFLVPARLNPTFTGGSNNYNISTTGTPNGWIALDGGNKLNMESSWQTYFDPLLSVPTTGNYYLLFFWHCDGSGGTTPAGAIDNICLTPVTCPQPMNLTKTDLGGGRVSLDWSTAPGNSDPDCGWYVEWDVAGFTPGTGRYSATTATKPFTVTGLAAQETYSFHVRAICCDSEGNDTSSYSQPLRFRYCNAPNLCPVNFTDLYGAGVTCTYGTFNGYQRFGPGQGPYQTVGVVNNGPSQSSSRHTVHDDPSEMDVRTGNRLPTIPNGYCESVRLGNWLTGSQCESISYDMLVDTGNFDIILLQYATVLENPTGHTATEQPRFTMEILDANNQLIDPTCGAADFNSLDAGVYGLSRGWHDANSGGAATSSSSRVYKDWTPVGINVSAYHGQQIKVRFTNFDCSQSGHYGYSYYTLGCQKARIISSNCGGNATEATLTAPAGFNYRWYNSTDTTRTISTSQTVTVTLDSSTYFCEVSFVEAPSCKFTLSVLAIPRFPHSKFSATLDATGCEYKVNVTNQSYVSISAYDTNALGDCEEYLWDWGDGNIDYQTNRPGSHIYSQPGTYTIMLVASISGGTCHDTSYYTVTFNPPVMPTIHGDSVVCIGTLARVWVELESGISYQWSNGATGSQINVYPTAPETYTVHVTDYIGCETDLSFHVDINTVPLPQLQPEVFESCVPYSLSVADLSPANTTNTYSWIWGDGTSTANNNTPTHTYGEVGNYTMRCCIKSAEGCFDTVDYPVYVYGFGHGSFSWNPPIITVSNPEAQFINLTDPLPTNRYRWEFFNHTTYQTFVNQSQGDPDPAYRWEGNTSEYAGNNLVRLITTNQVTTHSGGTVSCVDTVEAYVMIINDFLQFPNTVTANGDGINDIFEIKNLIEGGAYTDNELYIYNHWGRKVYHVQNISRREDFWDPAANGDASGTYYYRFSAKGYTGNILRNGTVQVLTK